MMRLDLILDLIIDLLRVFVYDLVESMIPPYAFCFLNTGFLLQVNSTKLMLLEENIHALFKEGDLVHEE